MAKSLSEALLKFQQDKPRVVKDSKNPHFGNTYASLGSVLEAVLPRLNDLDLLLTQTPTLLGGVPALRTRVIHVPTGESVEDVMPLMVAREDPQGQGSGITYARRYSITTMFNLDADEDDDGEAASTTEEKKGW